MAWIYLVTAGLLEVVWALALKQSHGFTELPATVVFVVGLVASMTLLALALKALPVGAGYAVWTGIGAVGTAIVGMVFFGDSVTALRLASIGFLLVGIVGLGVANSAGS